MNREEHVEAGDRALANASALINGMSEAVDMIDVARGAVALANVQSLAAIAQAHYAAANVRTRPIRDA